MVQFAPPVQHHTTQPLVLNIALTTLNAMPGPPFALKGYVVVGMTVTVGRQIIFVKPLLQTWEPVFLVSLLKQL